MKYKEKNRLSMKSISSITHGDEESDGEDSIHMDPGALLQTWLGQLDELNKGLDVATQIRSEAVRPVTTSTVSSVSSDSGRMSSVDSPADRLNSSYSSRTDSYRMSMAVLQESPEVDLDDILGELLALESQLGAPSGSQPPGDTAATSSDDQGVSSIKAGQHSGTAANASRDQWNDTMKPPTDAAVSASRDHWEETTKTAVKKPPQHLTMVPTGVNPAKLRPGVEYSADMGWSHRTDKGTVSRTDSPDNDSAFSDSVSMISAVSSTSSGLSGTRTELSEASSGVCSTSSPTSQADELARIKAEKIKLALEKIRRASIKKMFIKVFCDQGATKSLMIDETMSVGQVCRTLAHKMHIDLDPRWAIVEYIPDLLMERVYEDHENLVENLLLWTRDSKNQLFFLERPDKSDLFSAPHIVLLNKPVQRESLQLQMSMDVNITKNALVEDFFSSLDSQPVPDVQSELWLKSEGKKTWKKHHFILRASGIYYSPKGRIVASKDLICLSTFDMNQVYHGIGWRKRFKAPTDYCMAIKHPQIQAKAPKHICYLCADNPTTLRRWIMGIRIAKNGRNLLENHRRAIADATIVETNHLNHLHGVRTTSTLPADNRLQLSPNSATSLHRNQHERASLCLRMGANSVGSRDVVSLLSAPGSGGCKSSPDLAFDVDQPQGGTIRRRQSSSAVPKLPLTSTTRLLLSRPESPPGACDTLRSTGSSVETVVRAGGCNSPAPPPAVDLSASCQSITSLPLPPSPAPAVDHGSFEQEGRLSPPLPPPPPVCHSPPPPALPAPMPHIEPVYGSRPRRITFGATTEITPTASSPTGRAPPPPPPKRSQSTRLSTRKPVAIPPTVASSNHSAGDEFMRDLQRVMHKKWSVAEKCKVDLKSPHEVLGFREAATSSSPSVTGASSGLQQERDQQVGLWLRQHYGPSAPLYDLPRPLSAKLPPPLPVRHDHTKLSSQHR